METCGQYAVWDRGHRRSKQQPINANPRLRKVANSAMLGTGMHQENCVGVEQKAAATFQMLHSMARRPATLKRPRPDCTGISLDSLRISEASSNAADESPLVIRHTS